jgi:putative ABC transport system substrate-binding protein
VTIDYRWAEGHRDRVPGLAGGLAASGVSVIATSGGTLPARAAKEVSATIPIVFEVGVDPVETGLVSSFAHPGGNLTGITIATGDLNPKRLDVLSELVPDTRVIAVLANPNNATMQRLLPTVQDAARVKGLRLPVVQAGAESEFEAAFASLAKANAGALLVINDPFFFSRREGLVALAAHYAMPAMYEWREFVEAGGLASYGTSITGMYRRFGMYVGRVLSGAKPSDLPIEQPTKFELVLNLKTANALGLTIPQTILARADEVIE